MLFASWTRNRAAGLAVLACLACLAGCAHGAGKTGPATPVRAPRLAWLPVEPLVAPAVAAALSERLAHANVAGQVPSLKGPVSMEVAQLALECIEARVECYTAVGRSIGAERMVWAELAAGPPPTGSVKVTLTHFDVRT